jgi:hypothetical protein
MAIKVTVGSRQTANVTSAKSQIKVSKLEENVGNIDLTAGLTTGKTLVYNAETQKWVATDFATEVAEDVATVVAELSFDGGTY